MHRYILLVDSRFAGYAKKELRSFFGERCGAIDAIDGMLLAEIDVEPDAMGDEIEGNRFIFVYAAVPLIGTCAAKPGDYGALLSILEENLDRKKSFRIEVLNMKANSGTNAKSIEVKLGTSLEERGFVADLSSPGMGAYVILTGNHAFLGLESGKRRSTLDWFRLSVNKGGKGVSRAEFKLEEAAYFFGIDFRGMKRCIDIGAAPGGWSAALAKTGSSVLAVDQSDLDYDAIRKLGVGVDVVDSFDMKDWKGVLHLKKSAAKAVGEIIGSGIIFDMIMIDMNVEPREAAEAAVALAPVVRDDGTLLMTIKLVDHRVHTHIDTAMDRIRGAYSHAAVRKLPHNRREVTLYAKKG